MVVGGLVGDSFLSTVELVSLDPTGHPVPDCLKRRNNFPVLIGGASGASLTNGENNCGFLPQTGRIFTFREYPGGLRRLPRSKVCTHLLRIRPSS